ncbi:helix-turn-helix domain-containing protein [Nitrococcus mobilis]|uniref:Putative Fis-like DNA-binding protein n=1 Tax=Nitrococcus mobilis Nb-231 TaxID=314278 RepID=A4BSG3_9GAMM|nr:helix-turn-helix domain-containing protein [Nitrococcus mobilis]EAR21423.1 Helix-turn-helix, Fis-type [Nitrococcus mobilis Nb-231]
MVKQATVAGAREERQPEGGVGLEGAWPIRACVREALEGYFRRLEDCECSGLYKMVLTEVEIPLLQAVMRVCSGNLTKAAQMLGINRSTLRKKLQYYGLEH